MFKKIEDYIRKQYPNEEEDIIKETAAKVIEVFHDKGMADEEIMEADINKLMEEDFGIEPEDYEFEQVELFDGKTAFILETGGYDDGYYWELNAKVAIDNDIFTMDYRGSGSGYIETYEEFAKEGHSINALSGVPHYEDDPYGVKDAIQEMYKNFIESKAKESYLHTECETLVDGEIPGKDKDLVFLDIDDMEL